MGKESRQAFVLREVSYGENRRLLNLLTSQGEWLTCGCRKSSKMSSLNAISQLFVLADFDLFCYRDRWRMDDGHLIYDFAGLQANYDRLAALSHLAEIFRDALSDHAEMPEAYHLWAYTAAALEQSEEPLWLVRVAQFRFLSDLGFRPWLADCSLCHAPFESGMAFNLASGGLVCRRTGCQARANVLYNFPLKAGLRACLSFLADCPYEKLFQFQLTADLREEFIQLSDRYLEIVMGKSYHRLDFSRKLSEFTLTLNHQKLGGEVR